SDAPGVSGFEEPAQAIVREELGRHADEVWRDRMGNVIALRRAARRPPGIEPRRVMYAAHVDEIGMMVSHVDDDGFVRFRAVGGLDPRSLPSQRVVVHGTKGGEHALKGVRSEEHTSELQSRENLVCRL